MDEAKEYMDKYFAHYAGVRAYMDAVVEQAREQGFVSTLYGRRRWVPELKSSNFNTRSFGERVALNAPIQGTAADIIKLAMIRVRDRLKAEGLEGRLVIQVHDELIVECPESEAETVCKLVEEEMESPPCLSPCWLRPMQAAPGPSPTEPVIREKMQGLRSDPEPLLCEKFCGAAQMAALLPSFCCIRRAMMRQACRWAGSFGPKRPSS